MSRLALACLVILAGSAGCTRRQQDFAWFAAAVAVEVARVSREVSSPDGRGYEGGPAEAPPVTPEPYQGPGQDDVPRAHDVALELTKLAAHDARRGNCDAVGRTRDQVLALDLDVFTNVFLGDHEIQRCLAPQ